MVQGDYPNWYLFRRQDPEDYRPGLNNACVDNPAHDVYTSYHKQSCAVANALRSMDVSLPESNIWHHPYNNMAFPYSYSKQQIRCKVLAYTHTQLVELQQPLREGVLRQLFADLQQHDIRLLNKQPPRKLLPIV